MKTPLRYSRTRVGPNIQHSLPNIRFVFAVLAFLAIAGCGKKAEVQAGGPNPANMAGGSAVALATVSVAPATKKDISKTVEVTGSLVALQDVMVGARLAGRLKSVFVHEGDPVTAGQVVAVMDTADYASQV